MSHIKAVSLSIFAGLLMTACAPKPTSEVEIESNDIRNYVNANAINSAAHWINRDIILISPDVSGETYYLVGFAEGMIQGAIDSQLSLTAVETPQSLALTHPHLAEFKAFKIPETTLDIRSLTRGEPIVMGLDGTEITSINHLQFALALDDFYTSGDNDADEVGDYGATLRKDIIPVSYTHLTLPTTSRV